jgi:hypothetical protein
VDAAEPLERDAKARRELARAAGIALIDMSTALEHGLGVASGAEAVTFALIAFAARAPRLLRSAYRLVDVGERDAVVPIYRVMSEYLIVGRWLVQASDEDLKGWALDDLRRRLTVLKEVINDPQIGEDVKVTLHEQMARTEDAIEGYGGAGTPTTRQSARKAGATVPSLDEMAKSSGLAFAYAYPYRVMSQTDVHATPTAIDAAYEADGERGHTVRPTPRFALEGYESYLVGAHLLLDILMPVRQRVPELGWAHIIGLVSDVLSAIGRADPERQPLSTS